MSMVVMAKAWGSGGGGGVTRPRLLINLFQRPFPLHHIDAAGADSSPSITSDWLKLSSLRNSRRQGRAGQADRSREAVSDF
jgi:hypothetical protein